MQRVFVLAVAALVGCVSDAEPRPSGSYELRQQPVLSCSAKLPPMTTLAVSKAAPEVVIYGEYGTDVLLEEEGTLGDAANLRFEVTWRVYDNVDGVPTTYTVKANYELWGDSESLRGTAQFASPSYRPPCEHSVEST